MQQLQTRLSEVTALVESIDQQRSQLIKSAMDGGTAKVELELAKLVSEIELLKQQRSESNDYVDKMKQVIPTLKQMAASQEIRIGQSEQQIQDLLQRLTIATASENDLKKEQLDLSAQRAQIEKEMAAAQSHIGELRKSKDTHDSKMQIWKDRLNKITTQLSSARDRKLSIQDKIKFFEENLTAARKNISDLENLLSSHRDELEEIRRTRTDFEKLRERVEGQLNLAAVVLQKAQEAVLTYDSELSAMESVSAEEIAVEKLNRVAQTGTMDGYLGPLRSLIDYKTEYSLSIAALGREWLNAVLVRDVPSLLKVTEAAKKLKISRLTAIPLSEVGESTSVNRQPIPGVLSYVSEIISCDPGLKAIVDFVFGDSVIVDSPKSAFFMARKGFRAATIQGDVFEPDLLAFETGYSRKYSQITELLGQQQSYDGIRKVLESLQKMIEKRKSSISVLHKKTNVYESNEHEHDLQISKIETKLETTKQFVSKYAQDTRTLEERLDSTVDEIERLERTKKSTEKIILAFQLGSQKLSTLVSSFDLAVFDEKSATINRRRIELDSKLEQATSEIRELTTEITRVRGDLENSQRPALDRLKQQLLESEKKFMEKSQFVIDSEPKLQQFESNLASLKEREAETLDRASKYQPMLDELDLKLKSFKSEEDTLRKSLTTTDKEFFAANNDLTRLLDTERNLLGELAIYGFAEPIETFQGADELLRELNSEHNLLRNNVNFNADKNYREIFENYKYSSVRKNELEKERNAIVTFIETIDSEKRKVFMEAFERIDKELRIIFTKITGGNAWLEIEKPDSIFDSGVFLMAQFPGKLPRDSSSVSGGEKTMSAISFILAIQAVFPSPFYVFDEVDAHLDSVYSGKFAEILAERCGYSQIIIVSLKDTVVSKATSVIGVYMAQGSSRVIRYKSGMEVEVKTE